MRKRKDFELRKVGSKYMIVENIDIDRNLSRVFTLNAPAAYLWERIGNQEFDCKMLIEWLCEKYEVDQELASRDVHNLILEWKSVGLVTE